MRRLVAGAFVTLDGVMQAPGGPDEDREGGFRHGGWMVPFFDDELVEIMTEWTTRAGAYLFGRKTYQIFAAAWPTSTDPADEIAAALNGRPKYVASRTLETVEWHNATLLGDDVVREIGRLKAEDGDEIQIHGSAGLLQTLLAHDLVDILRIWRFPVSIGSGKRLFGEGTLPRRFSLVESRHTTTGAVLHVYERAGELGYGEVEVGRETVVFDSNAAR